MNMNKADFLIELSQMTREQINNVIESNGKEPKLINPIQFIGGDKDGKKDNK